MTDVAEPIGVFAPGSVEWHAARAEGLGGSEIAAVLGLSPWVSRFSLWHLKSGLIEPQEQNAGMDWGTRLEGVIAEKFAEDHPEFEVHPSGTWRSKERPWQIANPDRLLFGKTEMALWEGKTAHAMDFYKWGESGSDDIPIYYRPQVLWYLDVFGYQTCHLSVLIGGSDYREYVIEHSADEARYMRTEGAKFMESVRNGQRPDIDDSAVTYDVIRELHPDIDGTEKELPAELARPFLEACEEFKTAEAAKRLAAAKVLDAMGTAKYATWNGERIAQRMAKGDSAPFLKATTNRRAAA